ncbi:hypothetical protein ACLM44_12605 [Synechococcus sp. W2B2]|uniref:hypothetical protein n=1 Tax=unclassified Synechococcus TaxID=2626047 RepID=UPI0012EA2C47|nr:hypothetical protein [Synechococcus sp. WH 7805]
MPATSSQIEERQALESLCVRMPAGTKVRLENYRRAEGFRSMAEAARELMSRAMTEVSA